MKFSQNLEIFSKSWNFLKILKFSQNLEIFSKSWNFLEIMVRLVKTFSTCRDSRPRSADACWGTLRPIETSETNFWPFPNFLNMSKQTAKTKRCMLRPIETCPGAYLIKLFLGSFLRQYCRRTLTDIINNYDFFCLLKSSILFSYITIAIDADFSSVKITL
jgi:hypothetical protein